MWLFGKGKDKAKEEKPAVDIHKTKGELDD